MKLKDLAVKFSADLQQLYSVEEANSIFLMAVDHYLKLNRSAYLLKKEESLSVDDLVKMEELLQSLLNGEPIQYILGECYFYGLKFNVDPSVLIPRPETEELVEWVLETVSSSHGLTPNTERLNILDIGTGSGCIAISLKKNLPLAKTFALDISKEALKIAQQNAELNKVEIDFIQQDIMQPDKFKSEAQFDVIVSNPPYIKADEQPEMHQNVLDHEPHQALFVTNENPLIFYAVIADFALEKLRNQGLLFFEINEYLGEETCQLLNAKGFKNIQLKKDMQGKDRMVCCEKS